MKVGRSIQVVAVFEAAKGALVLLVGFGLLHAQNNADILLRHFHLNPASAHPRIFERVMEDMTNTRRRLLAAGALAYAVIRFIEAYGLWRERRWAEWFALASGAVYLPVEVYEFMHTRHWAAAAVFTVNALIVALLALRIRARRAAGSPASIRSSST